MPRILLANMGLLGRSGTEVVTGETACGLRDRGFDVRAYAPHLGRFAETLRACNMSVFDDLSFEDWSPDLIQANQTVPLLHAARRFPGVPIISICHDANVWYNEPFDLPQIVTYLAVDNACRDRITRALPGVSSRTEVLHNAVDLARFRPRGTLPERPKRALLLTKHSNHVAAVSQACANAGLHLEALGSGVAKEVDDLPSRLAEADLVFATARMALEALAVGCAVVVCDGRGLAGMVSREVAPAWRDDNFGFRLLRTPISVDSLEAEIAKYDAQDAARVTQHVRENASLVDYLNRLEELYANALARTPAIRDPDLLSSATDSCGRLVEAAERHLEKTVGDWRRAYEHSRNWCSELERTVEAYKLQDASWKRSFDEQRSVISILSQQLQDSRTVITEIYRWIDQLQSTISSYKQQESSWLRCLEEEKKISEKWRIMHEETATWARELGSTIQTYKAQLSELKLYYEQTRDWNMTLAQELEHYKSRTRTL